jgi:hypothetical protein
VFAAFLRVARLESPIAEFAVHVRGLGDETEFRLDAEVLERDGFRPTPAFAGFVAEIRNAVVGHVLFHDGYDTDAAQRMRFLSWI